MTRSRDIADQQDNLGGAVAPFVGAKNILINGGFDFWQRGTSSAGNNVYLADRWWDVAAGTTTHSQDTDVPSGVPVQYSIKWVTSASSSYGQWYQAVEQATVKTLRGQKVTYSAYVKTTSYGAGNLILRVDYSNSTDVLNNVTTGVSDTFFNGAATTSWTRITNTFTVPSDAVGLRLSLVPTNAQGTGVTVRLAAAQLELGSVATPFSRAGGSIGGELALCQRYYFRTTGGGAFQPLCFGFASSSTNVMGYLQFPVTMRTSPTVIEFSQISTNDSTVGYPVSAVAFSGTEYGPQGATLNFTTASMTTFRPTKILQYSTSAGYLALGAEL